MSVAIEADVGVAPAARPLVLLDPTVEPEPAVLQPARRVPALAGLTVGLIDNSKANAGRFLELLAERLQAEHRVGAVVWHHKPNASRPATDAALDDLAKHVQTAVAAVGD